MEDRLAPVLRSLPYALRGTSTATLPFNSLGQLVLPPDLPASLATALVPIAEPCVLYKALDATLQRVNPRSLLQQALFSGIRDSLRSYLALVSELEVRVSAESNHTGSSEPSLTKHSTESVKEPSPVKGSALSSPVPNSQAPESPAAASTAAAVVDSPTTSPPPVDAGADADSTFSIGGYTLDKGPLVLASLQAMLQSPTLYLRLFLTVIREALDPREQNILNALYIYAQHGDPLVAKYASELYKQCYIPFERLLKEWEDFGSLSNDVYGEFFVEARETSSFVHFQLVEARIPRPMTVEDARRYLERGRALHFIRNICGDTEFDGVSRTSEQIVEKTRTLLFVDYALPVHFRGLRDYMLLANGNFVDALFRNDTTNFLMQPVNDVGSYLASEFFVSAVDDLRGLENNNVTKCVDAYILGLDAAQTEAKYEDEHEHGHSAEPVARSTSLAAATGNQELSETANERTHKEGSSNSSRRSSKRDSVASKAKWRVWEAFIGKYHLDARPLQLIVDKPAVLKYERCFASLWRIRLAVYSLTEASSTLRWLARHRDVAQLVDAHSIMNVRMLEIQQFLYYGVIDYEWTRFEHELRGRSSLTQIKDAHDLFLSRIVEATASPLRAKTIQGLARLVLGFQRVLEDANKVNEDEEGTVMELVSSFNSIAASFESTE